MVAKVIDFPFDKARLSEDVGVEDNYIWSCECGGHNFELMKGGVLVCTSCSVPLLGLVWGFTDRDQT